MKSDRLQSGSVASESLYLSTGKRLIKRRTGLPVLGCIMLHPAMRREMALREHTQLIHHLNKCRHPHMQLCVRSSWHFSLHSRVELYHFPVLTLLSESPGLHAFLPWKMSLLPLSAAFPRWLWVCLSARLSTHTPTPSRVSTKIPLELNSQEYDSQVKVNF